MFIFEDENNDNFDDDDFDNGEDPAVYVYDNSWLGDKIYAAFSPS